MAVYTKITRYLIDGLQLFTGETKKQPQPFAKKTELSFISKNR